MTTERERAGRKVEEPAERRVCAAWRNTLRVARAIPHRHSLASLVSLRLAIGERVWLHGSWPSTNPCPLSSFSLFLSSSPASFRQEKPTLSGQDRLVVGLAGGDPWPGWPADQRAPCNRCRPVTACAQLGARARVNLTRASD